ncbi:hypothetical protein F0170_16025 [Pseudomonas sp. MAFF 730085]|uniref:Uncharacterized protein n=1 Tax=Pseudomonas kitaguniensis TaxID=2607908 RepID=A0A5N7JVF7_9PSED|nr:hypothetical protein [Pseudomonas kitaguniensis]MPQ85369.1 hypothetical protein [Pseudomonas kitaguniensis]
MIDDRSTSQLNVDRIYADMQAKAAKATDDAWLGRLAALATSASMQSLGSAPTSGFLNFRTDTDVLPTSSGIKVP